MEIVSEGSLESISRPASTSKRCSSRSSVRSATSSVQHSLDILPPEEPTLNWSNNFEVEEDIVVTDLNENANEEQDLTNESSLPVKNDLHVPKQSTDDEINSTELVEVEVPHQTKLSIQDDSTDPKPQTPDSESSSTTGSHDDVDGLDPKIRKGMERIRKLDNILLEKVKREKEVKKQRLQQERMWREHVEMLEKNRDADLGKQVDLGPAHMLALGAPNDTGSVLEDSPPVTPLFATQPLVDEERLTRQKHQEETLFETHHQSRENKGVDVSTRGSQSKANQCDDTEEKVQKSNKKNKKDRKLKTKDFIKRNILLAADASNVVAMTEEEKKRLEEILSDMGDLTEEEPVNKDSLILYGNGFVPTQDEMKQLADIDTRLQSLMPSEEYAVLCEQTAHDSQSMSSETPRSEKGSFLSEEDIPTFGELVLQERKEMREMKQRLMVIEEQLQRFQNEDHDEGILSESLLRQLLDDSSRTTSQATTIFDRISSTSMSCDTTSSFNSAAADSSISQTHTAEQ